MTLDSGAEAMTVGSGYSRNHTMQRNTQTDTSAQELFVSWDDEDGSCHVAKQTTEGFVGLGDTFLHSHQVYYFDKEHPVQPPSSAKPVSEAGWAQGLTRFGDMWVDTILAGASFIKTTGKHGSASG